MGKKGLCLIGWAGVMSCSTSFQIYNAHEYMRGFPEFSAPRRPWGLLPTFLQCYPPEALPDHPEGEPLSPPVLHLALFFFSFSDIILYTYFSSSVLAPSRMSPLCQQELGPFFFSCSVIQSTWYIIGAVTFHLSFRHSWTSFPGPAALLQRDKHTAFSCWLVGAQQTCIECVDFV